MLKKILSSICAVTIVSVATYASQAEAIPTQYYYDGETPTNLARGGNIAKTYPNSILRMKPAGHSNTSKYKAVGYVQNYNGFNGGKTMGSGTVIDDYTILTNAHVIDNQYGKATAPRNLRFYMNRDGGYIPYMFTVKKIRKIKNTDLALLYTNKKLSTYVRPMVFASEREINSLKKGTPLYSVGYPYYASYEGSRRYWYRAIFLTYTTNKKELMMKDKIRGGNSGSPLVNSKFRMFGVRTYGERVDGYDENKWAKYELGGSIALKGAVRQEIVKYKV